MRGDDGEQLYNELNIYEEKHTRHISHTRSNNPASVCGAVNKAELRV
jgi:hypothetical protein